ncbi:MAG: hypothetical protein ABIH46_09685 [Chloroflexota bacterium]
MLETIFQFVFTVPVANPVLRALIIVVEVLVMGTALCWWWGMVPRLVRAIVGAGKADGASHTARADEAPAGAIH